MHRTIRGLLLSLAFSMLVLPFAACNQNNPTGSSSADTPCGNYKGRQLYIGSQGGCYYYTSSGKKSYVDRENCDC